MHELGIADEILHKVLSIAKENEGKQVKEVVLGVGRYRVHETEGIDYAFRLLARDTELSDAKITVVETDGDGIEIKDVVFF